MLKDGKFYNRDEYDNALFGSEPLSKKKIEELLLDNMENDRLEQLFRETGERYPN
jgi:hypothetical protein